MRLWPRFGPRWPTAALVDEPGPRTAGTAAVVDRDSVAAAAVVMNADALRAGRRDFIHRYESWQEELWSYYETTGEYGLAVTWRANMISRVHLRAAEVRLDSVTPAIVESGPAAELVHELFATTGSQNDIMGTLAVFLDVPGEGWLVGETLAGRSTWRTYSSDEIRRRGDVFEVITDESYVGRVTWRELGPDSLVVRVYRPDKRLRYLAYSPAKAARSALRELDLVNRHIQAQYLSRLASAGIIVLPDEITFPVREEFQDEADPFIAEWIETARQAIERPGTAAAVIPIPMRLPGEYVDKVRHIDFTLKIDEKIIEKRDSARRQLASQINVPTELLFDAGTLNHWGLWQLEESGVKAYIAPDVELIAGALTVGYLRPRLRALGEDPDRWVIWYDAAEITTKPDRSESVIKAYDRFEVSGKTLRREIGLTEHDAPTSDAELNELVLKRLAANPQVGLLALHELTGLTVEPLAPTVSGGRETPVDRERQVDVDTVSGEPPDTREDAPRYERPRAATTEDRTAFTILQASTRHVLRVDATGLHLGHPRLCEPKLFSCPFTHETHAGVAVHPGTSGDYECYLSATGDLVIGRRIYTVSDDYIFAVVWSRRESVLAGANGHVIGGGRGER